MQTRRSAEKRTKKEPRRCGRPDNGRGLSVNLNRWHRRFYRQSDSLSTMSTLEISATLRIDAESADLASFIASHRDELSRSIGPPSLRDGSSICTIDLTAGETGEVEAVLDRSVESATALRGMTGLPANAAITVWIVVWSSKEFVGLALSEELVDRASKSRVSFVFSVYGAQQDDGGQS